MTDKPKPPAGSEMGEGSSEKPAADQLTINNLKARSAKLRKSRRIEQIPASLDMLPMMALFTVILCALLKDYQSDPVQITPNENTRLPKSSTTHGPKRAVLVAITNPVRADRPGIILVDNKKVAIVERGRVPARFKEDENSASMRIEPLFDALEKTAEREKLIAKYSKKKEFKGLITIVADKRVPFRLLTEVLYTAGKAEYGKFKFAVIKEEG
jgi:biopolymer transport protein ExbD